METNKIILNPHLSIMFHVAISTVRSDSINTKARLIRIRAVVTGQGIIITVVKVTLICFITAPNFKTRCGRISSRSVVPLRALIATFYQVVATIVITKRYIATVDFNFFLVFCIWKEIAINIVPSFLKCWRSIPTAKDYYGKQNQDGIWRVLINLKI